MSETTNIPTKPEVRLGINAEGKVVKYLKFKAMIIDEWVTATPEIAEITDKTPEQFIAECNLQKVNIDESATKQIALIEERITEVNDAVAAKAAE